jgi:hypothetical protein
MLLAGCAAGSSTSSLATEASAPSADQQPTNMNQSLFIPDSEIPALEKEALEGSGQAAEKLALYYDFFNARSRASDDPSLYWHTVAAENGNCSEMHWLGYLLSSSADPRDKIRSRFWEQQSRQCND